MAAPLTDNERAGLARRLPSWVIDGETLRKTFEFADFAEALGFVVRVGVAAEAANHHPDISISWSRVTLTLTTHSANALTGRDRDLAGQIDGFAG